MKKEEIVSDLEIERVHGDYNFGSVSKRQVLDEVVIKTFIGFHSGSTALWIGVSHGLIRTRKNKPMNYCLAPKGRKYLKALRLEADKMLQEYNELWNGKLK